MEEQSDSTFVKNISIVIGLLIVFAIVIAFVARDIGFKEEQSNPSSDALTEERIKPVAAVYTGEAGAAAPVRGSLRPVGAAGHGGPAPQHGVRRRGAPLHLVLLLK